jgi:hypothetical protein
LFYNPKLHKERILKLSFFSPLKLFFISLWGGQILKNKFKT